MKVSTEKIPDAQVLMTIEVEKERVDEARGKALKKLAPKAKIPGFRPGKAPAPMVERYFGEERILDEALDLLVPDVYKEAVLADESIDPIARPKLVVETVDPLVVKATIPVRPDIELGDYRSVRIEMEPVVVGEERVEQTVLALRRRAATHEPIERGLRWRDIARIDVRGEAEGKELVHQQDIEVQLNEEWDLLFPGFEEELLGHAKGETVVFDLAVPEAVSDEEVAGKKCHFTVAIHETKEEILPELDDQFLKQIGDYDSADALRQRIRESITREEQERLNARYHEQILDMLVERATIEYPPVMVDSEVDRLLHDQAGHIERGQGLEAYLAALGKTEQEVRDDLRPVADMRLKRSLVLSKVTEVEAIDVAEADVDAEVETLSASGGQQAKQLKDLFGSERGRETIRRNLLTRRTLERLIEIAGQDGGTDAALAEQPSGRRKPKSGKSKKVHEPAGAAAQASEQSEGD